MNASTQQNFRTLVSMAEGKEEKLLQTGTSAFRLRKYGKNAYSPLRFQYILMVSRAYGQSFKVITSLIYS